MKSTGKKGTKTARPVRRQAAPAGPRGPAACSVIIRNQLAYARALARSFLRYEPSGRFYLLIADLPEDETPKFDRATRIHLIRPEELALGEQFRRLCFELDSTALLAALRPRLISTLLSKYGESCVASFDARMLVLGRLGELLGSKAAGITLVPRLLSPISTGERGVSDADILRAGACDDGVLAVRRGEQSSQFLDWWFQRSIAHLDSGDSAIAPARWLDLAATVFSEARLLRDPSYNAGFSNLHERSLSLSRGEYLVNRRPLQLFSFAGFDPATRTVRSARGEEVVVPEGTALARLLEQYASAVEREDHETSRHMPYGYATFDNGVRINPILRQMHAALDAAARLRLGDPFKTENPGGDSFYHWATRPRAADGNLSRFLASVYAAHREAAIAFRDVSGADREAFLEWARTHGESALGFEPALVRDAAPSRLEIPDGEAEADVRRQINDLLRQALSGAAPGRLLIVADEPVVYDTCDAAHPAGAFPSSDDPPPPVDGTELIDRLELARERGEAHFLLLPGTSRTCLARYPELREHLERHYPEISLPRNDLCLLFDVRQRIEHDAGLDEAIRTKRRNYERLVRHVRCLVRRVLPMDARILVVSKGDDELLKLGGRAARHFPPDARGGYAGFNPRDSAQATDWLETLRQTDQSNFLIFPMTASWWLDHYREFAHHLKTRYHHYWRDEHCIIFRLDATTITLEASSVSPAGQARAAKER